MAKPGLKTPLLSKESQKSIITLLQTILTKHKQQEQLRAKMEVIDVAYARYKESLEDSSSGVDIRSAEKACDIFASDEVTAPIVVSQVDTVTSYLAEVFLSGYPTFPVVSNPSNRQYAEQLETLLDDHALLGGYPRQLLMFLRNAVKYNFGACEADWDSIDQFTAGADFTEKNGQSVKKAAKFFTRLKNIDIYNFVYDPDVLPGDIAEHGDYAGYIEMESGMRLKRRLNKYSTHWKAYNVANAMSSGTGNGPNFQQHPQISNYISKQVVGSGQVNWIAFAEGKSGRRIYKEPGVAGYEIFTCYCRILPGDHGISAPQPNTPQIWKFVLVNNTVLCFAERIISAYDYLPILVGQPIEDGMRYQTQSVAESEIPFQDAASKMFNIRFSAARRAVSDRALYRPDMIDPNHVNNAGAAPKIPVRISSLQNVRLEDAYKQIPFDMRGTEGAIQDAQQIVRFSEQLHGNNGPTQGQFQKGNKSVTEWNDTMAGADGRKRLYALSLEHQFFSPLKSILALNIFQYGDNAVVISQKSGETLKIDIAKLREQALSFKISDGYTPKSKMASTEMLTTGLQLISTSPILQQAYGASLPDMFAHMMQLGGVRGLEEYSPSYRQQMAQQGQPAAAQTGVPGVQAPMAPVAGMSPMGQAMGGIPPSPPATMQQNPAPV